MLLDLGKGLFINTDDIVAIEEGPNGEGWIKSPFDYKDVNGEDVRVYLRTIAEPAKLSGSRAKIFRAWLDEHRVH